jgi:hypothetical protein
MDPRFLEILKQVLDTNTLIASSLNDIAEFNTRLIPYIMFDEAETIEVDEDEDD